MDHEQDTVHFKAQNRLNNAKNTPWRRIDHFISPEESGELFLLLLNSIPWEEEYIFIFGRERKVPRLVYLMGDEGIVYTYSGVKHAANPWIPAIQQLIKQFPPPHDQHNFVLLNYYRHGLDSMGWHADDEPELGPSPAIASLSLGGSRDFHLRRKGETRVSEKLTLKSGSLLLMHAGMQSQWEHSLPKRNKVNEPRINLTFRTFVNL